MATKIYTKTGDDGTTGLFGGGRVPKNSARIAAYGDVDELDSAIGMAAAATNDSWFTALLHSIQSDLFVLGADLATPLETRSNYDIPRISERDVTAIEKKIDEITKTLPELTHFILPGGNELGARFHLARTVCRRAERSVVHLAQAEEIGKFDLIYLNRLSDLLFVLARLANHKAGIKDIEWRPKG